MHHTLLNLKFNDSFCGFQVYKSVDKNQFGLYLKVPSKSKIYKHGARIISIRTTYHDDILELIIKKANGDILEHKIVNYGIYMVCDIYIKQILQKLL